MIAMSLSKAMYAVADWFVGLIVDAIVAINMDGIGAEEVSK